MSRGADTVQLSTLLAAGGFIGLTIWAAPDLRDWLSPHAARAILALTPAQAAAIGRCDAPVEGEHMMILLTKRDGRIELDRCQFVGSRGTYSASTVRASAAP